MRLHVPLAPALALVAVLPLAAQSPTPRIEVGQTVRVSGGHPMPHDETAIDAAPWDPEVLVSASHIRTHVGRRIAVYSSRDRGATWTSYVVPGLTGDPQVVAGRPGVLLVIGMSPPGELLVARSEDSGINWSRAAVASNGTLVDRPHVVVDRTGGAFDGRIYVNTTVTTKHGVGVFYSDDDGKTWQGPAMFVPWTDSLSQTSRNPVVLADGALVLPYVTFPRRTSGPRRSTKSLVTSTDGGETFTAPRVVHEGEWNNEPAWYAADPSPRHRNRLYMAWWDYGLQPGGVFVRHSDDRGQTWSAPVFVDPAAPPTIMRRRLTLAVNKDGVVGVRWLDSRHAATQPAAAKKADYWQFDEWDEYFTASVDGGASFLPPVRVSGGTSRSMRTALGFWSATTRPGGESVEVSSDAAWGAGDYLALAADAQGRFWPAWIHNGSGTPHIYTAPIRVTGGTVQPPASTAPPSLLARGQFHVEFDPMRYDSAGGTVELPVRVRNVSGTPIQAPRLTVTMTKKVRSPFRGVEFSPMDLLNGSPATSADSGQTVRVYDLAPVLDGDAVLLPGERTRPLVLRLRAADRLATSRLSFALSARPAPTRDTTTAATSASVRR